MSLLAEEIVEEWLNRQGFFTIRGLKVGHGEIDLLAIKPQGKRIECRHVEVQCSVNPVSYICGLPRELQSNQIGPYSATSRTKDHMTAGVKRWIEKKFRQDRTVETRHRLCAGPWSDELVVHRVKHPEELRCIRAHKIRVHHLEDIVAELLSQPKGAFRATGSDFIDLLGTAAVGDDR
jgi:hypothetical protein